MPLQIYWKILEFSYIKDNDFFFWKLDRRNKIYLLEVYKFLLVEEAAGYLQPVNVH